jgi:hypothetical protein
MSIKKVQKAFSRQQRLQEPRIRKERRNTSKGTHSYNNNSLQGKLTVLDGVLMAYKNTKSSL